MRRAQTLGTAALVAGLAVAPAAFAAGGLHGDHVHSRVRYEVTGVSTTAAPTTTLGLSGVKYHPKSLGTLTTLAVKVDGNTKYVGRHGQAIASSSVAVNDRIEAIWIEPTGTTPSLTLAATKIVDLGPPPPVHFYAWGKVGATVCTGTKSVTLATAHLSKNTGEATQTNFAVAVGGTTIFAGRHDRPLACGDLKMGDRILVTWAAPAGSTFVPTATASRVQDPVRRHRHLR
jgi:hypothetical protein